MRTSFLFVFFQAFLLTSSAVAQEKVCLKVDKKFRITRRAVAAAARCPKGFTELLNTQSLLQSVQAQVGPKGDVGPQGPQGPQGIAGPQGPQGIPGTSTAGSSIFGDGSSGDVTFPTGTSELQPLNLYGNITIPSGATLKIPHGSTLRCSGTLTIAGVVEIQSGGQGGASTSFDGGSVTTAVSLPAAPLHLRPASRGQIVIASCGPTTPCIGAAGLASLPDPSIPNTLRGVLRATPSVFGGGGSGSLGGIGGNGGGSATFACGNGITITNSGVVRADGTAGQNGGGGGAGGFLVFATNGTFTNSGLISAKGGNGGALTNSSGAGGGGAGGWIHILAAQSVKGTVTVGGGAAAGAAPAGHFSPQETKLFHFSGGGAGGSLAEVGGDGASVATVTFNSTAPSAGADGYVVETLMQNVGRLF